MATLLFATYLALGALIVAVEFQRLKAKRPMDALSFFNGAYLLFFVIVPLNVLVLGEASVRQKYAYQTWSHGDIWTALGLSLSYAVFVLGWRRASRWKSDGRGSTHTEAYICRLATWLAGLYFLVGIMALAYHISLVGGVIETLRFAPDVRTGAFPLEGSLLFLRQFLYFLPAAFMLVWAVYIESVKFETNRKILGFLLVALGLVFVYYSLASYGRREFLYPLLICLVIWTVAGQRRLWGGFALLVALSVVWLYFYSFAIPVSNQSVATQPAEVQPQLAEVQPQSAEVQPAINFYTDFYLRTIQGLGDSFMHFVASRHADLWQFGFLSDFWELPLQFLPSSLLGFERPRGMLGETSEFILGYPLEPGFSGEEPLGLHGYLLVNFSWLGMLVLFYLAGVGYRYLDAILRPEQGGSAISWLVFLWAVIGALEFLREGFLIFVLKPRFSWWLAIGILLWLSNRRAASANNNLQQHSRQ